MKITYTENPLRTKIELDEFEQKELWYKVKLEEMEDLMFSAHFHLEEKHGHYSVEKAKQELNPDYYMADGDEKTKLDERVDMLTKMYIEDLQDIHCGDCTCVAMSCSKCHAEYSLIGVHTTEGLRKHEGSKVAHAFDRYNKETEKWETYRTIHEVVDYLKDDSENFEARMNANPPNWVGWESHVPRWKTEAKNAYEWMKNYRDTHFPLNNPVDPNSITRENTRV